MAVIGCDITEVFVNASPDVAKPDAASAVHQCHPREFFPTESLLPLTYPGFWNPATREPEGKLKYIKELQNTNSAAKISSNIESNTNLMFSSYFID